MPRPWLALVRDRPSRPFVYYRAQPVNVKWSARDRGDAASRGASSGPVEAGNVGRLGNRRVWLSLIVAWCGRRLCRLLFQSKGEHWPIRSGGSMVADLRYHFVEKFNATIWDPACGIGRIVEAARRAGYTTCATDIVDRGYPHFCGCLDFLLCDQPHASNIIFNPPFARCNQFIRRALTLTNGNGKVAAIWLVRRLNAARWLADTPQARIYLLTPRPSMPPGHVIAAGEKPGGGTQDFCWLVFSHKHKGPPTLHWLCRDGGDQ
jgi:hypothetical protein